MPVGHCTVEIYVDGRWRRAAEVHVTDTEGGTLVASRLEYDFDYVDEIEALGARDHRAVSCRYPLGFEEFVLPAWPSFLLDVIPSGAARRWWEARLRLRNVPRSDWQLLVRGGGNPPGNVRIAEAVEPPDASAHPGFTRDEIIERNEGFIEYARERGASIAGGSGAGGDAPKFLLREDEHGRFHADGALEDTKTRKAWLVKFPRSSRAADRLILEAEAPYHRLAARLGARVSEAPAWERDALFVPRFDRIVSDNGVRRLGLESLYSLAGVSDFGVETSKEDFASAIARFTTNPSDELRELLLRDVLDVALGNTDNHGRNTAVLKKLDGRVELAPIYDFCPMVLDPQGIARVSRWRTEDGGYPDFARVIDALAVHGLDTSSTRRWMRELGDRVGELPSMMRDEGVPSQVRETLERRIRRTMTDLTRLR